MRRRSCAAFDERCEPDIFAFAKDPLSSYKSKREFGDTPEPSGSTAGKNKHRFVIQRHKAKRAGEHFDLRLENDEGAMTSWSIPKHRMPEGKEKLLAIKTEDHPLEYRTFEGEIPKGEYGAGKVSVHDSGTYDELEHSSSKIVFKLKGKKEKGTYRIFKTDGKRWMIMEHNPGSKADDVEKVVILLRGGEKQPNIQNGIFSGARGRSFDERLNGMEVSFANEPECTGRLSGWFIVTKPLSSHPGLRLQVIPDDGRHSIFASVNQLLLPDNVEISWLPEFEPFAEKKASASRMKAISVRQPWASLIADGGKTIETRTWGTKYRGPLLIVSSAKPKIEPAGFALAIADLVDCRPMTPEDESRAMCESYPSANSWVLDNIRKIEPFRVRGALGLYDVEMPKNPLFVRNAKYIDKIKQDSGNITYVYSDKHIEKRNIDKAKRLRRLNKTMSKLRSQVRKDLASDDKQLRNTALAVAVIDETYSRVGNRNSADEMQHYGLTTWMVKHVSSGSDGMHIRYVGKTGVKQDRKVTGKPAKLIRDLCKGKKKNDTLFAGEGYSVTPKAINAYLSQFGVSAKDIRGLHANSEMVRALKKERKGKLPSDEGEKKKKLKEEFNKALESAADRVGHQAGTLRRQYLIPSLEPDYLGDGKIGSFALDAEDDPPLSAKADWKRKPYWFEPYEEPNAASFREVSHKLQPGQGTFLKPKSEEELLREQGFMDVRQKEEHRSDIKHQPDVEKQKREQEQTMSVPRFADRFGLQDVENLMSRLGGQDIVTTKRKSGGFKALCRFPYVHGGAKYLVVSVIAGPDTYSTPGGASDLYSEVEVSLLDSNGMRGFLPGLKKHYGIPYSYEGVYVALNTQQVRDMMYAIANNEDLGGIRKIRLDEDIDEEDSNYGDDGLPLSAHMEA